jgi:hypothetical protein
VRKEGVEPCQLRHVRIEPPAGTDPAAPSVPRTCSAIELRRHELEDADSNHDCRGHPAERHYPILHCEPSLSADLSEPPLQGAAGRRSGGPGALGGIRTRNIWHLGPASLPCWSTSTRSLRPGSNGLPLPYGGSALPGELRRHVSRVRASCPAVSRPGIGTGDASRTRMPRGLGSRGLPVASLPRGAPPEARTPFPGVRAQCITRHACGAWSGIQESNLHSRFGGPAH